jgi:hypothetical protein
MLRTHTAIVCMVLTLVTQSSQAQSPLPPRTAVIPKGTVLKFATVAELNSATARKGDAVPLRLTRPLVINGITLLPVGAQAHGRVTKAKRAGPKCAEGSVEWSVDRVSFPDSSAALTEVWAKSWSGIDLAVPEMIDSRQIQRGRHFRLMGIPEMIVLAPLAIPYFLVLTIAFALDGDNGPPCTANGSEYIFSAGSTVGVAVARNHTVRY